MLLSFQEEEPTLGHKEILDWYAEAIFDSDFQLASDIQEHYPFVLDGDEYESFETPLVICDQYNLHDKVRFLLRSNYQLSWNDPLELSTQTFYCLVEFGYGARYDSHQVSRCLIDRLHNYERFLKALTRQITTMRCIWSFRKGSLVGRLPRDIFEKIVQTILNSRIQWFEALLYPE